jgi:hypothetical protein
MIRWIYFYFFLGVFYLSNYIFMHIYLQAIVGITPQLITLNQRAKSNIYRKNK